MPACSCSDRVMKPKILVSFLVLLLIILVIYAATEKQRLTETNGIGSDEPVLAHLRGTKDVQQKDPPICSANPVEAAEGDDVTLDCHLQPEGDVTGHRIEWKFNKTTCVLVYRSRDFSQDVQDEHFRDRATLGSGGNLSKGKIPVTINNVTKADAGKYTCSVGKGKQQISCSTELTVVLKQQHIISKASNQGATLPFILVISTVPCLLFY